MLGHRSRAPPAPAAEATMGWNPTSRRSCLRRGRAYSRRRAMRRHHRRGGKACIPLPGGGGALLCGGGGPPWWPYPPPGMPGIVGPPPGIVGRPPPCPPGAISARSAGLQPLLVAVAHLDAELA